MSQRLRLQHAFMRSVDRLTQLAFHLSGGLVGGRQGRNDVLLLTTVGRKTGKRRTHALLYIRDGDRYVVCASNFGAPWHPAWYLNLAANPTCTLRIRRRSFAANAAEARGDERARLWRRLVEVWPSYFTYQANAARLIPVVILAPDAP